MSDPDSSQLPTKGPEKPESRKDPTTRSDPQSFPTSPDFPQQIGRYRILRRLGRGGMGEVFEAEQTEPVHRKVALKLIKGGMDTQEVLARFDSERQALALMNHLNVARMLDGGATEQGRPYFVMEYIQGVPITEYCDAHELSTSERLELFVQVCDGIQHAHQKGIVHRDIKPSNVLVTVEDQKVIPKIIDFGLAKALGSGDADMTQFTHTGQVIGTPTYMSPEQVSGSDIDTRTDVYSLGVLLYQLLVGTLPFDLKVTPQEGWDAFLKKIREQEPVRPSVRTSSLGDSSPETAKKRRIDPASWARELHGDLDWITLRALEKDRTRRYQSPSELAADITRHLNHEPVLASPPSTVYRVRKFIRRHRFGVAAAAVVALAFLAGITGTTIGLIRATRAERKAVEEAENTRQLSDFLLGLFRVSDPSEARGNTITAREILDRGAQKIERELGDKPVIKAEMMRTIGRVYDSLGLYNQAQPLLEKSLAIARTAGNSNRLGQSNSMLQLAVLYGEQGKYRESLALAQESLHIREGALGPNHPEVARALLNVGIIYRENAKYTEAKYCLERSVAIRERALGPDHRDVMDSLYHLGWLHNLMGNYKQAQQCYEHILAVREKLGPGQPEVAGALSDLGFVKVNMGDYTGALKLFERALQIREKVLGPDHSEVASSVDSMGTAFWYMNKFQEARPYYERALQIREKAFGPDSPRVAPSLYNLAILLDVLGEGEKSLPLYERKLALEEKAFGPGSAVLTGVLTTLAGLLDGIGEFTKSRSLYSRALEIQEKTYGAENVKAADLLAGFAYLRREEGSYQAALSLYERALKIQESTVGGLSSLADTLFGLAHLHADIGNYETAVAACERVLGILEKKGVPGNLPSTLTHLAKLHRDHGQHEKAQIAYKRALSILEGVLADQEKTSGPEDPKVAYSLENLAKLHGDNGYYEKACSLFDRALAIQDKAGSHQVLETLSNYADLQLSRRKYAAARLLYERALEKQEKKWGPRSGPVAVILVNLGRLNVAQGKFIEAESYFARSTAITQKIQGDTPRFFYSQACYRSLLKDQDKAIFFLKQAVARGFDSKYKIAHDPDLASLRGDPEFKAILNSIPDLEASQ
jgi:eukaryotic-like serine/threonine-protein kinase